MSDDRPKWEQALVQARYYAGQAERMVRDVEPTVSDLALVSQAFSALVHAEITVHKYERLVQAEITIHKYQRFEERLEVGP